MDQTCIDSLAQADDRADLVGYDFAGDGLGPQLGPDSLRLLAYRYREMHARYLSGRGSLHDDALGLVILQGQPDCSQDGLLMQDLQSSAAARPGRRSCAAGSTS